VRAEGAVDETDGGEGMIDRYSRPEMIRIWSDENRYGLMFEVESIFLEVLAKEKRIPANEMSVLKKLSQKSMIERLREKEATSGHEVVALLQAMSAEVEKKAPLIHRFLHYGLTSSDVLDTVLALQLVEASKLLVQGWREVCNKIRLLSREHEMTMMAGRTHGVHAEPMTLGVKFAGWYAEAQRNLDRIEHAQRIISYGKLSGAVGTYSQLSPAIEAAVCKKLGLEPETVSTQVVPRDRHAEYYHALVLSAAAIERFALEIRHLQRTEVLEIEEPFGEGQKGSSAMPHKRNPVLCENLCGLSRLIRSAEGAIVESIALWHERDISHSSVERVALPDATVLLDFMLHRFAGILNGLQIYPEHMQENMERSKGLIFSQNVLLKLIDKGLGRFEAYDLVQRNAMKCWKERREFREILAEDPAVMKTLGPQELEKCFSLNSYRRHAKDILKRAGVL
jgi:adenylosuccinate lyase